MMRQFYLLLIACLLASPALAVPQRIVSLDLCTDWMLLKYTSRSQVLAYSSLLYSYPADWVEQGLPVHNASLEQIVELKPDLVISGEYNASLLRKRLKQLGFKVAVLPLPNNLQSIKQYAEQFMTIVQGDVTKIQFSSMNPPEKKNKSLLLLGANGIATGKGTLEDDILTAAGWNNYSESSGYISLDLERLVAHPPDAIYYSAPLSNSLANLFAQHIAIKKRVSDNHFMRDENWRWQCPGPWTFDLIQELAQWQGS
jgi:iron complex transport system substrate-binding protein